MKQFRTRQIRSDAAIPTVSTNSLNDTLPFDKSYCFGHLDRLLLGRSDCFGNLIKTLQRSLCDLFDFADILRHDQLNCFRELNRVVPIRPVGLFGHLDRQSDTRPVGQFRIPHPTLSYSTCHTFSPSPIPCESANLTLRDNLTHTFRHHDLLSYTTSRIASDAFTDKLRFGQ